MTQAASSLSSGVTRPLCFNNRDSRHQKPWFNLKIGSDRLPGTCLHAAASPVWPKIFSEKIFDICLNFHSIISIGVLGAMFMKHVAGPGNLQPIDLYFAARCWQA